TGGLYVNYRATNVLINMGADTLVFGANGSSYNYGIRIAGNAGSPQNVTIRGGWIIHGGGSSSDGNNCLEIAGGYGVLVDSVSMVINGTNGACVTSIPPEGRSISATNGSTISWNTSNKEVEIWGGRYISYVTGYTSRCSYDGAVFLLANAAQVSDGQHNFIIHDIVIENAPCQGIVTYGVCKVYRNTITVDCRNFMYSYPSSNFCESQANAYCILARMVNEGSEYYDNVLMAGNNYYGADGGFELEGCIGTPDKPVIFRNNYMNIHRGWDVHYGWVTAKGFKIRRADQGGYIPNKYVRIYENDIFVYAHTDTVNYKAYGRRAAGFYVNANANVADESIIIERNYIRAIILDTTRYMSYTAPEASGFLFMTDDYINQWTVRYNHVESNHHMYHFGGFDAGGDNWSNIYEDTLIAIDTAAGPTQQIGMFVSGDDGTFSRYGNVVRDSYWIPDTLFRVFDFHEYGGAKSAKVTRTVKVYVRGNNGLPVVGASVRVINNFGQNVFTAQTDSGGLARGVATIHFGTYGIEDSTNFEFNDFVFSATRGGDSSGISFTVTAGNYRDTLTLQNTVGTGTWRDDEPGGPDDNIPPGKIIDLGAAPGGNDDEVLLTWTAPGDDGSSGQAYLYDARYSTSSITGSNWYGAIQVTGEPTPGYAGSSESFMVRGLPPGDSYYFAVKTRDEVGNWSEVSNVVSVEGAGDASPPGPIVDLDAASGFNLGEIYLTWTATGDDGSVGTADRYEVRYSGAEFTGTGWDGAILSDVEPTPFPAGARMSCVLSGLQPGERYYVAVKAYDDADNESGISNVVSAISQYDIALGSDDTINIRSPGLNSAVSNSQPYLVVENVDGTSPITYLFELSDDSTFSLLTAAEIVAEQPGGVTAWKVPVSLSMGVTYYWHVKSSTDLFSEVASFSVIPFTHVYPNPFNPPLHGNATFAELPENSEIILMTVSGSTVRKLTGTAGEAIWDGTNESGSGVASGTYLWFLEGSDVKGKLIVVR
ncbi:MAG: hypothetical protein JSU69_01955, partial [Candidatus Zixiibacteriota bacterium]